MAAAVTSVALTYPDNLEVQVVDEREGLRLVAVVELVSPRNKDRADARDAFTAKCSAYLQRGVGVGEPLSLGIAATVAAAAFALALWRCLRAARLRTT